jgi:hypothetical protein
MEKCLIDNCGNEARLISKTGGISFYSCKKHEREVAHIATIEHTRGEMDRATKQNISNLTKEDTKDNPKWMKI